MTQFGRYEIQRELGRGGMGIVYLARDPVLTREIAIKTLVVPHTITGDAVTELVERFRREARNAAAIKHACVPEIYDIGEAAETQYIALEYCPGRNLREVLNADGPFKLADTLAIAKQLLDALETAHLCGVFHRDVKPENVMIRSDGSVKLMDFGIARAMGDVTLTRTGATNGTPAYMAPEQVAGHPVDGRSDLFSFAIMFTEMLSGKRPFDGATIPEILHAIAYEVPQLPLSIAPEIRAVIQKALNKDAAKRFYSAKAMAFALSGCAATKPAQHVQPQPARRAAPIRVPAVNAQIPTPAPASLASKPQTSLPGAGDGWFVNVLAATLVGLIVIGCFVALMRNLDAGHGTAPHGQPPSETASNPGSAPDASSNDPPPQSDSSAANLATLKITGNKAVNSQDGAALVLIPAGSFQMGDSDQNDNPIHTVELPDYWMYKNLVTVGQYKKFCSATGRQMPIPPSFDSSWSQENHPVVNVSWDDARAYCNWAGVSVPTEAQWEKAARGTEGLKYPWGNDWDDAKCANSVGQLLSGTAVVGQYTDSPYGLSDMAGNVWQWCVEARDAPVIRGGAWDVIRPQGFRASYQNRYDPNGSYNNLGFRCAASAVGPLNGTTTPGSAVATAKTNSKDGAAMILIPAGSFQMGDSDQNDNPTHTVELSDYWMYKNLVTVGQYKRFCRATGREMTTAPSFDPSWSQEDHPVVDVSWDDATDYCKWAGVQLPTEAEWEKAARGVEGLKYPWGTDWDPARCANSVGQPLSGTVAVGQYAVSPYGLSDVVGNTWEWCADWYDDAYCKSGHGADPKGPASGRLRVLRGGSWIINRADIFCSAVRFEMLPGVRLNNIVGFRCAAGP